MDEQFEQIEQIEQNEPNVEEPFYVYCDEAATLERRHPHPLQVRLRGMAQKIITDHSHLTNMTLFKAESTKDIPLTNPPVPYYAKVVKETARARSNSKFPEAERDSDRAKTTFNNSWDYLVRSLYKAIEKVKSDARAAAAEILEAERLAARLAAEWKIAFSPVIAEISRRAALKNERVAARRVLAFFRVRTAKRRRSRLRVLVDADFESPIEAEEALKGRMQDIANVLFYERGLHELFKDCVDKMEEAITEKEGTLNRYQAKMRGLVEQKDAAIEERVNLRVQLGIPGTETLPPPCDPFTITHSEGYAGVAADKIGKLRGYFDFDESPITRLVDHFVFKPCALGNTFTREDGNQEVDEIYERVPKTVSDMMDAVLPKPKEKSSYREVLSDVDNRSFVKGAPLRFMDKLQPSNNPFMSAVQMILSVCGYPDANNITASDSIAELVRDALDEVKAQRDEAQRSESSSSGPNDDIGSAAFRTPHQEVVNENADLRGGLATIVDTNSLEGYCNTYFLMYMFPEFIFRILFTKKKQLVQAPHLQHYRELYPLDLLVDLLTLVLHIVSPCLIPSSKNSCPVLIRLQTLWLTLSHCLMNQTVSIIPTKRPHLPLQVLPLLPGTNSCRMNSRLKS